MGPTYIYACWGPLLPVILPCIIGLVHAIHNQLKKAMPGRCEPLVPTSASPPMKIKSACGIEWCISQSRAKSEKICIEQNGHNREKELNDQKWEDTIHEQSWSPSSSGPSLPKTPIPAGIAWADLNLQVQLKSNWYFRYVILSPIPPRLGVVCGTYISLN